MGLRPSPPYVFGQVWGKIVALLAARAAGGVAWESVPACRHPCTNSLAALCLGGRSCDCDPSCVVTQAYVKQR